MARIYLFIVMILSTLAVFGQQTVDMFETLPQGHTTDGYSFVAVDPGMTAGTKVHLWIAPECATPAESVQFRLTLRRVGELPQSPVISKIVPLGPTQGTDGFEIEIGRRGLWLIKIDNVIERGGGRCIPSGMQYETTVLIGRGLMVNRASDFITPEVSGFASQSGALAPQTAEWLSFTKTGGIPQGALWFPNQWAPAGEGFQYALFQVDENNLVYTRSMKADREKYASDERPKVQVTLDVDTVGYPQNVNAARATLIAVKNRRTGVTSANWVATPLQGGIALK